MEEFLQDLSSQSWWLSVVVCGLVINLLAAYIKPSLDRLPGWLLGRIIGFKRAADDGWNREVEGLVRSSEARITRRLERLEYLIKIVLAGAVAGVLYAGAAAAEHAGRVNVAAFGRLAGFLAVLYAAGCNGKVGRLGATLADASLRERERVAALPGPPVPPA